MIHLKPLPGTPNSQKGVNYIIREAIQEADALQKAGIDGLIIENMHDIPYLNRSVGPEITSIMSIVGYEVKNLTGLPCGIQILAGANKEALAAAHSAGLDFIRAEGYVFAHIADEGIMESSAGDLLRYRKQIGADQVDIFTDVKKKHCSHAITGDMSCTEMAKAAEFFQSDGVIITGHSTGQAADAEELKEVYSQLSIPVLVGSGITINNLESYLSFADALIVGSYFKKGGNWQNELDYQKVERFMDIVKEIRKKLSPN